MRKKTNPMPSRIILCFILAAIFIVPTSCQKDQVLTERSESLGISSEDSSPSWSPDGSRIVFASGKDELNFDIYTMNIDGTGKTKIAENADQPFWSPDGRKIAFYSNRDGNFEIYVMDTDGSNLTRLTDNPARDMNPSWSPDGSKIVFGSNRDGNWEIYTMNADGSGQTRLTDNPARDTSPSWSPDGSKIVFGRAQGRNKGSIFMMNADGSDPSKLTEDADQALFPAWSPDGRKIIFNSRRNGNPEIYTMNPDGTGQTRLTDNAAFDGMASWSPDGRKIVFVSDREFDREVYVMDADGSNPINLTNNAPADATCGRTPVAKSELNLEEIPYKIVFQTLRETDGTENWEICLIDADGSNMVNLTNTPEIDERYPHASPDGRLVCYIAAEKEDTDSKSRNVYIMNIDGTDKVKIAENADQPFWSPDGRYIAYLPGEYPRYTQSRRANKGLAFYDLETGERRLHPNEKIIHLGAPVWSRDGKWIVAGQNTLKAFSVEDDTVFPLFTIGCTPDISPDGKRISWNNSDFHMNMGTLDLDSPESNVTDHTVTVACEPPYWVYESDWSPDGNYWAFIYGVFDDELADNMGLESRINICICDLRTGKWTQITHEGKVNREPDWVAVRE